MIRGFDGDRILVATDGIRINSIAALGENEAEPIDLLSVERVEIVRGPGTLLYGSNAIGGVVNAISRHDEDLHKGTSGYFSAVGGVNNKQAAVSGGVEHSFGNFMVWGNGSGQRTSDYNAGEDFGRIGNTYTRYGSGDGGFGYFAKKGFFTANYNYYQNRYGIPIDPAEPERREVSIRARRHDIRLNGGFRDLDSFIESVKFTFDYGNYRHLESEIFGVNRDVMRTTNFSNNVYSYRGVFGQRRYEKLTGTFGFDGYRRNYSIDGSEPLVRGSVKQDSFAVFGLEAINLNRVSFQFGGRVENNRYRPTNVSLINRDLTGFSGAAGTRIAVGENNAFVANYSHSTRLPDLEEFYNNGPHDDTLSFEIGDPHLKSEVSDGLDFSFRRQTDRVRAEVNFFYYNIKNFVFLEQTGEVDKDTELPVAIFVQGDSRFFGTEASLDVTANKYLNLTGSLDYVNAKLKSGINLPRIPPFRTRLALDAHYKDLSVRPEVVLVARQDRLFTDETPTAGYTVFNIAASYIIPSRHYANIFSVNAYNLTNKLYFNHISFIKDLSPEIGRGVRFSYTIRFF